MHWWLLAWGAEGWQHCCDNQWDRDSWLLNPVTQVLWLSIWKYYKKYRLLHRSRSFLTHMVSLPALSPEEDSLPVLCTEVVLTQSCGQDTRAQTGRLGQCLPWKDRQDKLILSWLIWAMPYHATAQCSVSLAIFTATKAVAWPQLAKQEVNM